jgi:hypothetical protein
MGALRGSYIMQLQDAMRAQKIAEEQVELEGIRWRQILDEKVAELQTQLLQGLSALCVGTMLD